MPKNRRKNTDQRTNRKSRFVGAKRSALRPRKRVSFNLIKRTHNTSQGEKS